MPAKQKRDARERGIQLQQQGCKLENKADYTVVCEVLKIRSNELALVKKKLTASGFINEDGTMNEQKTYEGVEREGKVVKKEQINETIANLAEHVLHRNFNSWGAIPPQYQVWLLSQCEPISLSKAAFNTLVKQGCKAPHKTDLNAIREYISDIPDHQHLGEDKQLASLSTRLNEKNLGRNRRAKELCMPANWERDGFFQVAADATLKMVSIIDKITGGTIGLKGLWEANGKECRFSIDMNYSRMGATLMRNEEPMDLDAIFQLFASQNIALSMNGTATKNGSLAVTPKKISPLARGQSFKSLLEVTVPTVKSEHACHDIVKPEELSPKRQKRAEGPAVVSPRALVAQVSITSSGDEAPIAQHTSAFEPPSTQQSAVKAELNDNESAPQLAEEVGPVGQLDDAPSTSRHGVKKEKASDDEQEWVPPAR